MIRLLGILVAVIFAVLSLLHFYWATGGKAGGAAIPSKGGRALFEPSAFSTAMVALALLSAMLVVLGRLHLWGDFLLPNWIFYWGTWVISLMFFLRAVGEFHYVGFFKSVTNTDFARWDYYLFSPLCLFIAVVTFLVNLRTN